MDVVETEPILLDPHPHKRFLLNQARSFSPDLALFEFIDNAIDNWRRNDKPGQLDIRMQFHFEDNRCQTISITDNGGGVPQDRLRALVQAGAETTNGGGIGVWGSGLKIGAIALCSHWTIETSYPGEVPRRIDWPASWWDHDTWDHLKAHPFYPDDLPEGSFRIHLQDLHEPLSRHEVFGHADVKDPLTHKLGRVYAPLLGEEREAIRIRVQDGDKPAEQIEPTAFGDPAAFDQTFAYPPGFEPRTYRLVLDREQGLNLDLVVGLLPEQNRDLSGVSMYGKGRLFVQALKEGTVGFGTRGRAKIPASHPTTWRLAVFAYFDGPPDLIPWGSPTKEGYKEANPYRREIREAIMEAALPYATFTKVAKRIDILPFSAKWRTFSDQVRRTEIQRYTKDQAASNRLLEANPHLLEPVKPKIPSLQRTNDLAELQERAQAHLRVAQQAAAFLRKRDNTQPDGVWSTAHVEEAEEAGPEAAYADPWKKTRRLSLSIPEPTATLIEREANAPLRDWIMDVIDRHAAELDPVWSIPQRTFRTILKDIRTRILENRPGVQAVGVFGSVARGQADRESDIDLLVIHPERLDTQVALEKEFKGYRHPPGQSRYSVQLMVSTPEQVQAHAASNSKKFQAMLDETIWIHGRPTGGSDDIE